MAVVLTANLSALTHSNAVGIFGGSTLEASAVSITMTLLAVKFARSILLGGFGSETTMAAAAHAILKASIV